nr:MAG TPA: hypothetical protein [Caudoviricetes sp.]
MYFLVWYGSFICTYIILRHFEGGRTRVWMKDDRCIMFIVLVRLMCVILRSIEHLCECLL